MASDPVNGRSRRWATDNEWMSRATARKPGWFRTPADAFLTIAWWCLLMLIGAMLVLAFLETAFAHDPKHPEWNSWLMSQHNQNDAVCCDGNDTFVLADDEWRTENGHYEVLFNGAWHKVPDWALTRSQDNVTGSALLWVWQGHVQCFKPGTFY